MGHPGRSDEELAMRELTEALFDAANEIQILRGALEALEAASGDYCKCIDAIGESGEPPEQHIERLDALDDHIRAALVVARKALRKSPEAT